MSNSIRRQSIRRIQVGRAHRRSAPGRRVISRVLGVATVAGLAFAVVPAVGVGATGGVAVAAPALPQTVVGLHQGAQGTDVKSLQQALLDAGVPVPGGADGVFGPATKSAVTAFQSRKGLTPSGKVDDATAKALGLTSGSGSSGSSASASGLTVGAQGDAVKALQRALMDAGVWVAGGADGVYGQATKTAVSNFQRWNGLEVTGTVTPATEKALRLASGGSSSGGSNGGTASPAPAASSSVGLKIGATGGLVKALQQAMINAGVSVRGGADGQFGPATQSALIAFQKANGLTAKGVVDQATATKLGLDGATPAAPAAPAAGSSSNGYVGLKYGSSGDKVKQLQRALMNTGLTLLGGADGVFGNATKSTLILFQRVNGIDQTGVLTEKGAGILGLGSSSGAQGITSQVGYPKFGERGARVTSLQKSLLSAGISFSGGADGVFGAATAGAIMDFQRREGLSVTGKVDDATANALGSAKAPAPAPPSAAGVKLDVFPVQGQCWFGDTYQAPRGGGRTHEGVDIIAAKGKRLYAVVDGTISKQYYDYPGALSGNGVRLAQPNGTYFTYLHLSKLADGIEVGTKVKAGQVIGYVGNTGNSATPHLHFEIHPNGGGSVNPYPLVKAIDACNVTAPRG